MSKTHSPLHRFSEFVVSKYRLFFIIFAALSVFSLFSMGWVKVENDVAAYLPESYEAKQGLDIMARQFDTYGTARIMLADTDVDKAARLSDEICAVSGVESCEYSLNDDGYALFKITLSSLENSGEGEKTVGKLRDMFDGEGAYIYSDEGYSLSDQITSEVRGLIGIVAVILIVVLTFTSTTYAEVPILLITFLAAALINKGTNFVLGTVSFISDSVTIILQLAMSVDYAIIFCNRYKQAHETMPVREAVVYSLEKSIVVISSSSLTTMAGLLAMTFMKFGIGRDLGVALIKSIVISLMTVFLLMPGLLFKLGDLMDKTRHRNFVPKISPVGRFAYAARRIIPVLFVLVLVGAYVCSQNVNYAYSETLLDTVKQNENQKADHAITEQFGSETTLAIVVPAGDYDTEAQLIEALSGMDKVKSVTGVAGIEGPGGYKLADKVSYSEFASLAGVDNISAQALFALYAADNGEPEAAAEDLGTYKAPLIRIFMFLSNKADDGTVELSGEQAQLVSSLNRQLKFAASQLEGTNYDRLVLTLGVVDDGDETFALLDRIHAVVKQYYPDESYLVGNSMSAYGFKDTFTQDNMMVSMMSIVMVMLVLLLTFKSVGMPVLLTLVIQGSIWINFGLTVFTGKYVLFMVYLVASAIQMGCNVDYAIVVATHYNDERAAKKEPRDAMTEAMNLSFPTIITSGTALVSAGLLIGAMVSSGAVAGMGHFVGIGSLITLFLVMFVLPALLLFGDGLIARTAIHIRSRDPQKAIRRAAGWGLAAAVIFTALASPYAYFSCKSDTDARISEDERIIRSAKELGALAITLGAEKETWDAAKLSFAESVVTDNVGRSKLYQGQSEYDEGSRKLSDAKAQYAAAQARLEQGRAEYAEGQKQLEAAKAEYAAGQARLEKIKPLYDAVNPPYQRYLELKAQYDVAVASGDKVKAALLWSSVEAQRLLYENEIMGTGYSIETIVSEYEAGRQQLADAEVQISAAEQQLADAKAQLEQGQKQLDEAAAQIAAGQDKLDKAEAELEAGRGTLSANEAKIAEQLDTLEKYGDDESRLQHGIAMLMQSEEISSRAGENAAYADICAITHDHYDSDIRKAERENALNSAICALVFASAVLASVSALMFFRLRRSVPALAAIAAIVSAGCAAAASAAGLSALIPCASLALMLFSILFAEIFLKNRKEQLL